MNIVIYGAGALGSFIGGVLSTAHNVTLVGRSEHMNAVNRYGLRISGKSEGLAYPTAATMAAMAAARGAASHWQQREERRHKRRVRR